MNEQSKHNVGNSSHDQDDLVGLLKKIEQHLVFLEKKIDILVGQSAEKSFNKPRHFSKPHKSFGHDRHERHDRGPRDRNFSERRPFEKSQGQGNDNRGGFGSPRKRRFFRHDRNRD